MRTGQVGAHGPFQRQIIGQRVSARRAFKSPLLLCKSQVTSRLLCGAESGSIMMFPAAMPPGWPPAPTGSRRLTDTDQVPAEMGFSSRYALFAQRKVTTQ